MKDLTMFRRVELMHEHFNFCYHGTPRELPHADSAFRRDAMYEEIGEYCQAVEDCDLGGQFDALIDLIVFALGAGVQHGFDMEEGFKRVMTANMQKKLVERIEESKRGHLYDLKKPPGWREPYFGDLLKKRDCKGIIILDGPDNTGKSTLAKFLKKYCDAHIIHSTWSPELEERMYDYIIETFYQAMEISTRQLVIVDRSWLSDLVYGDVFRDGETQKRHEMHNRIRLLMMSAHRVNILCLPYDRDKYIATLPTMDYTGDEPYRDMNDIYNAYQSLYVGERYYYKWKHSSKTVERIIPGGGLIVNTNQMLYDYTLYDNPDKMEHFSKKVLRKLI